MRSSEGWQMESIKNLKWYSEKVCGLVLHMATQLTDFLMHFRSTLGKRFPFKTIRNGIKNISRPSYYCYWSHISTIFSEWDAWGGLLWKQIHVSRFHVTWLRILVNRSFGWENLVELLQNQVSRISASFESWLSTLNRQQFLPFLRWNKSLRSRKVDEIRGGFSRLFTHHKTW